MQARAARLLERWAEAAEEHWHRADHDAALGCYGSGYLTWGVQSNWNYAGALATLAVRNRPSQRYLLFDTENTFCGWQNIKTGEIIYARESSSDLQSLAFSGIHVLNPEILKHFIPEEEVFSLIDLYLQIAGDFPIKGFRHDESRWIDVGKPENLAKATNFGALN